MDYSTDVWWACLFRPDGFVVGLVADVEIFGQQLHPIQARPAEEDAADVEAIPDWIVDIGYFQIR